MQSIPFTIIDWDSIQKSIHSGAIGQAEWQTLQYEGIRVRIVHYSKGYLADHWCSKGHIVQCLEGSFTTELKNGSSYLVSKGMGYIVSDDMSEHRSITEEGVTLLIIDGDFLNIKNIGA
jgi:hypothetical protein